MTCSGDSTEGKFANPLQAWMPSAHVWSDCVSPTSPQLLNQAPPRAQQLGLPALLSAHLPHQLLLLTMNGLVVFVRTSVGQCWRQRNTEDTNTNVEQPLAVNRIRSEYYILVRIVAVPIARHKPRCMAQTVHNLPLQDRMPSVHV